MALKCQVVMTQLLKGATSLELSAYPILVRVPDVTSRGCDASHTLAFSVAKPL